MIAAVLFVACSPAKGGMPRDWALLAPMLALLCLCIVQLLPLPPLLWKALPGREPVIAALELVEKSDEWAPISVSPYRTLASALALIPPIVMFGIVSTLSRAERSLLLRVLAALGLASAVVGAVQLVGGRANWLRFYENTHLGFITGFQANRNAAADLLLIAALAVLASARATPRIWESTLGKSVTLGAIGLLAVSTILTGSRAGVALILVAAVFCVLMLSWHRVSLRRWIIGGGITILAGLAIVATLNGNANLNRTFERFATQETRTAIWSDTSYAIQQYWPVGSGIGTFEPTFIAAERLELVDASRPNRAHNDYLEFLLEAGLAGIILVLWSAAILAIRSVGQIRRPPSREAKLHAVFALGALAVFALHSLVDYPMRSISLACVAAFAVGLLTRTTHQLMPIGVKADQGEILK